MNTTYTYLLIAAILVVLELIYFRVADHFNIIDKPNLRSSHSSITLRGGGIIFPLSMVVYALFYGISYPWFFVALMALSLVSFIDDIRSVPNSVRLIVQFLAMFMVFWQWGIVDWQSWWIIIIALIFCTGVINAYNFMDGINGVTGGYSLAVLVPLLVINHSTPFIDASIIIVSIISVIVFCLFNFRKKAKCFAGDVGSISIAFIIIFLLGKLIIQTGNLWYIMLLALYGVDTVLTIVHRIMLHESLGQAHRKHAYQLMANELHIPHVVVSSIYMVIQFAIAAGLIWLPVNKWLYSLVVLLLLCVAYILFKKKYYHLHEEYLKSKENVN